MPKKIAIAFLLAATFGALLYATVFFLASHGDAFNAVEQALKNSSVLQSRIGRIEHVRLSLFGPYDEKSANDSGWATMTVDVIGSSKTATLRVVAKKEAGVWKVDRASIDGESMELN